MSRTNEVITLTLGDCAERKIPYELIDLSQTNPGTDLPPAYLLVIRQGLPQLLGQPDAAADLYAEQTPLDWDKKCFMYGRVVNKHARWNLCYDEKGSEPDYENKKGRVIALDDVPRLQSLMRTLEATFGEKMMNLKVEGNRYYDTGKCGIGWHGDSERVKVVAVRLGTPNVDTPILYQWYKDSNPVGEPISISLKPGDIYMMSEKAVGTDWKRKTVYTLRHATGASKFTGV
jgi:alkylated DNA repair dioxygenase AlkB